MSNEVVNYYENYREEDRITTNNARRIEFLTTIYKFDKLLKGNLKILDCAAGTGAYAFYLADKGHNLTATDITPRHIKIINEQLKDKTYSMETKVLDATDMRCFEDGCFDVVLNMGPFYHLTDDMSRNKCLSESIRILKKRVDILLQHIFQDYILIRCLLCQMMNIWTRNCFVKLETRVLYYMIIQNAFGLIHIIHHTMKCRNYIKIMA